MLDASTAAKAANGDVHPLVCADAPLRNRTCGRASLSRHSGSRRSEDEALSDVFRLGLAKQRLAQVLAVAERPQAPRHPLAICNRRGAHARVGLDALARALASLALAFVREARDAADLAEGWRGSVALVLGLLFPVLHPEVGAGAHEAEGDEDTEGEPERSHAPIVASGDPERESFDNERDRTSERKAAFLLPSRVGVPRCGSCQLDIVVGGMPCS